MTTFGKLCITIIVLALLAVGIWKWKDKIAPAPAAPGGVSAPGTPGQTGTSAEDKVANIKEITSKLLAGDREVSAVGVTTIPPVKGVSNYKLGTHNGKPLILFPINVWPGWSPLMIANNGMEPNEDSIFAKKGFYVKMTVIDDPVKNRDLMASGQSPVMWTTLDMIALFAPELIKDSRTVPLVPSQIDFSAGGDGIVARNGIASINDLKPVNGVRRKVVVAQNSPSHFLIMSLLLDARINPDDVTFIWSADPPAAAKIFAQDKTIDAFVGFAPDIYTLPEMDNNNRLIVTTASANRRLVGTWAVRNDFANDHPEIVQGLVEGLLEGIEMVRANPDKAAEIMAASYSLPVEDCKMMIGKDGGIATGDAHLVNYRENEKFFFDPKNPANFEAIYNQAAAIYQSLGAINTIVPSGKVKYTAALTALKDRFADSRDLSQPVFNPGMTFAAESDEILTKAVVLTFKPNTSVLDPAYDPNIPQFIEEIGKLAGGFGNAYIVIEGNADASRRGVVPADQVRKLSYDRADAVKNALLEKFTLDPNQFKVQGNGWDNPLPNATDPGNAEHNKANRRVEVKVYPLESAE